jgi:lysophospholipase L1-like esterase
MKSSLSMCLILASFAAACSSESGAEDEGEDPDPAPRPLRNYVAQGDSYASGTGTGEYYDAGCQRSNHSYAVKLAAKRGLMLTHAACSGARIPDVRANQLAMLSDETDLVTLSIGGNDAGFSRVITECAKPAPFSCEGDIAGARTFISDTLPGQLDSLYTEIEMNAPNARVIVLGYPHLFNGEQCNILARISPAEQDQLNGVADLLATKTAEVAAAHGFELLDVRTQFTGHRICDDVEWLNGLSNPIGESYHPNRAGHDTFTALLDELL